MTASPQIEKLYECKRCRFKFDVPLRIESAEGEYNACRRCENLHIKPLYIVSGVGAFDDEGEAYTAYFDLTEDLNNENKM
ncbi:MAG: hypothetical protein IJF58_04255 [Clostridia bacterium]|nr:hypothetical protein [Clostridia bacterium]